MPIVFMDDYEFAAFMKLLGYGNRKDYSEDEVRALRDVYNRCAAIYGSYLDEDDDQD